MTHSRHVLALGLLALLVMASACRDDTNAPTPTVLTGGGGASAAGGAGGSSGPASELKLMTWNLETFPLTGQTSSSVMSLLETLQPDVVAVEEIEDPAAFIAMVDQLPDYEAVLNDDPGGFLRVGLLYAPARVTVSEVETLFVGDWHAFPRPPLKARIETTVGGEPFDFVMLVLHLKAKLDSDSQQRREAACEALDAWIRQQQMDGDEQDFVLAGDFNDELTDPPKWNVFDAFLNAPERYTFLTLPAEEAGGHTYLPFTSFIDHILVTNDALTEYGDGSTNVLELDKTTAGYEQTISDHRPVMSVFTR